MQATRRNPLDKLATIAVVIYRNTLALNRLRTCRFYPTCSAYAIEAISRHGFIRGGGYTLLRLLRCHPFGKQGIDTVPK